MPDDKTVRNVFLGKPDWRRKLGRPKLRWLDCTEDDKKPKGVQRWRKKAEDICMGYHLVEDTGYTIRTICQRSRFISYPSKYCMYLCFRWTFSPLHYGPLAVTSPFTVSFTWAWKELSTKSDSG
jgi:hypothetical protein